MIVSRKMFLVLSVLVALALYAVLFAVAPNIPILRANAAQRDVLSVFKVDIYEEPAPVTPRAAVAESSEAAPASVREIIEQSEELTPSETLFDEPVETPNLTERAGAEDLEREYDLEQDVAALQKMDAKILEISEETAREDIDVARRNVRPSGTRVVEKGEFPVLRGIDGRFRETEILFPGPAAAFDAWTPEEGAAENAERPEYEEGVLLPVIEEFGLPELPIEETVARAPVREAIRAESPYEFIDDLVHIELDTYVPDGGGEGFFRLRIIPREDQGIEPLPKDVTFVIDASNSILQRKLDLTVRGVRDSIAGFRPEDRFNIVLFRGNPTMFRPEPVPATSEIKQMAYDYLDGLQARGETDVYNALQPVIAQKPREGVPHVVMVLTDGRPTTGVMDARDIINGVTAANTRRTTIYAFGGGNTVNRYLLDLLAYRNKGESYVADNMNDIDDAFPRYFARLSDPILVGLEANYAGIGKTGIYPKELPDFYRGRVVAVYGRFDASKDERFVMRLQGKSGSREKELVFQADLQRADTGDAEIARRWAFQKIYHLVGEISRVGEDPALVSELHRLSDAYNIRTSYTP